MFIIHAAQYLDPNIQEVQRKVRDALIYGTANPNRLINDLDAIQSTYPQFTENMIGLLLNALGAQGDLHVIGISNRDVFRWIIRNDTRRDLVRMLDKMIGIVNPNGSRNEVEFINILSGEIRGLSEAHKIALITKLRNNGGLIAFLDTPNEGIFQDVRSSIATLKALLLELDSTYPPAT